MDADALIDNVDDEDPYPPPLTNSEEQKLSLGLQNAEDEIPEDDLDDELISLVAPVDEVPTDDDGEFRLSIEGPPPVVMAEMKRMSKRMSRLSKIDAGVLSKVNSTEYTDEEGDKLDSKVMEAEAKLVTLMAGEETNIETLEGEVFSALSAGEIQEEKGKETSTDEGKTQSLSPIMEEEEKANSIVEDETNEDLNVRGELKEKQEEELGKTITDSEEIEQDTTLATESNAGNTSSAVPQEDTDLPKDTVQQEEGNLVSQEDTNLPKDTVQKEEGNSVSLEVCSSNCQPQKITLGEPEKEQLKAAGIRILEIGHQVLEEMNFIESLLSKFGLFVPKENDKLKTDVSGSLLGEGQERASLSSSHRKSYEKGNDQITDGSIAAQAAQVCWWVAGNIKVGSRPRQSAEDSKLAAKVTQFGSGFESPHFSRTSFSLAPEDITTSASSAPPSTNQNNNYDLRKRLAALEIKFEGMCSKVEVCDKQVKEAYQTLCGALNKLTEETAFLKGQIDNESDVGTMLRTTMEGKINSFQEQILKLAKIIWEMKCEARAQMHFGRME